jgi:hypothetical protein
LVNNLASAIEPLTSIDWDDIDAVEAAGRDVLEKLNADRTILRQAMDDLPNRPALLALCEHPDPEATAGLGQQLDKIVLYSDEKSGVRVRLHAFWEGCADLPHNHRWSFVSMVLHGQFRHSLFGPVADDATFLAPPRALHVRQEQAGTIYALHHDMLHALTAEPNTVSLVIRGPAAKDRSFLLDPATGERLWHVGAGQESPEEAARKQMTPDLLRELGSRFAEWGLF